MILDLGFQSKYLLALYDLRNDMLKDGIYQKIKEIREAVTHRKYDICSNYFNQDAEKTLFDSAIKSVKLARCGIIYLIMHIDLVSANKYDADKELIMNIHLQSQNKN